MKSNVDLLATIKEQLPSFSKGQKLIANYILEHYEKAAFMTAAKLGVHVGVSESTVVRFATEIGYSGYPELQRALQEMIRNKLTSVQRIQVTNDQIGDGNVLEKVLNLDLVYIRITINETSQTDFNNAVNDILKARKIYILAARSASALANFLYFYVNLIFDNVELINSSSASEVMEHVMRVNEQDVVIGISFPRYSTQTIKAFDYVHNKGATIVAITDSKIAPIAAYANHLLLARSDMVSFVDSLVAPLSLINALIVALGLSKKEEISKTFETLEDIWDEYNIYQKTND